MGDATKTPNRRVLIIQGHPDPSTERLCRVLSAAYSDGAKSAGAEVRTIDIASIDFPLLRTKTDWKLGRSGTPESLVEAQGNISWMNHLMLIYPLWLGTMPALTKGFLEQVLRPGVALSDNKEGFPQKLLSGCSARVVITMGMPALAYRWYFRAHSLKSLERNILKFCGINPVRETLIGMVETVSPAKRESWIKKIRQLGQSDGKP